MCNFFIPCAVKRWHFPTETEQRMLNSTERQHVLAWYRFFSKVGALPVQVNVDCWKIRPGLTSAWKKLASRVSLGIFLTHALYKILTLAHAFMFGQDIPLYQLAIHIILAAISAMCSFWYYVLYIRYPDTFAAFARITLTAKVPGGELHT